MAYEVSTAAGWCAASRMPCLPSAGRQAARRCLPSGAAGPTRKRERVRSGRPPHQHRPAHFPPRLRKSACISWCLNILARSSGVSWSSFRTFMAAPRSMSSFAVSRELKRAAKCSAMVPTRVALFTRAPRSMSSFAVSRAFISAASVSGVEPTPSAAFTSAPRSMSSFAVSREFASAAYVSGTLPSPSAAFTSAPQAISAAAAPRAFAKEAIISGVSASELNQPSQPPPRLRLTRSEKRTSPPLDSLVSAAMPARHRAETAPGRSSTAA